MTKSPYQDILNSVLRAASDTKYLLIGRGNALETPRMFAECFPGKRPVIVADTNTFNVCGKAVHKAFVAAGIDCDEPHVFDDPALYADYNYVDQLEAMLKETNAIPVAVGSGTINDVTKLSAHHCGRRYICVATAASMDGYTAYGASITYKGSKQTFDCPAPLGVIADLDVIAAAPKGMNASGYADLLAKLPAGADWILADALEIEPIDNPSWEMVQKNLRAWLSDPAGVANGAPEALESLVAGLMMGGFAMQHLQSSRPASGAEHQFSHLWDMQGHKHEGKSVSHGFKVGIGTLSSAALYEFLYQQPLENLDVEAAVAKWPSWKQISDEISGLYDVDEIRQKAMEEARAKYSTTEEMTVQLNKLKNCWPKLRSRLQEHLPPVSELRKKLELAGAPATPEAIGVSQERLQVAYRQALHIRRRFTVLDVADRTGLFPLASSTLFSPDPAKV